MCRITAHHGHRASVGAVGVGVHILKPDALLLDALQIGSYGSAIHNLVHYGATKTLQHYEHYVWSLGAEKFLAAYGSSVARNNRKNLFALLIREVAVVAIL